MNARGTRRPRGSAGSRPRTSGAGRGSSTSGCAVVLVVALGVLLLAVFAVGVGAA